MSVFSVQTPKKLLLNLLDTRVSFQRVEERIFMPSLSSQYPAGEAAEWHSTKPNRVRHKIP